MRKPAVLVIAASSSDGCAGLQMDVRVLSHFGLIPACAITAITAQNSLGVQGIWPLPAKTVRAQIDSAFSDLDIRAVKIGMLWSAAIAVEVAKALGEWGALNVIFDPVMSAQADGRKLAEGGIKNAFRSVAAVSDLVTPNLEEAKALSGVAVKNRETACRAAWKIMETGAQSVLLKSYLWKRGWLADLLFTDDGLAIFKKEKLATSTHGGGCLLSSAIAARMALGDSLVDAVSAAESYADKAIAQAIQFGAGIRAVNPSALQVSSHARD